jgi:mono/diheme cytochrome c family protein
MSGRFCIWVATAFIGVNALQAAPQATPTAPAPASQYRAVLNRYCVTCHNEKLNTAGLQLDKADVENISAGAEVWEKVVWKLRTTSMPPAGAPRPDPATYKSFATYLEKALDSAAAANPNPGRPAAVHRLNRSEYANAIRDLLALDTDAESLLPADDSGYGFDNIGAVLTISPMLMERYLGAARKISRLALGRPIEHPDFKLYEVPSFLTQDDRMSEDLPFGSRGGIAVRHLFPLDGEYVIKVRLQRTAGGDNIIGLNEAHQVDVRLDGARVKLFTVGGGDKQQADTDDAVGDIAADAGLEVRVPIRAGTRLVGVTLPNEITDFEGVLRQGQGGVDINGPSVDQVSIQGPYNAKGAGDTPSRRGIFVCTPARAEEEEACAKKILATLGRRAYRRPLLPEDVQSLMDFYKAGRANADFEAGIETALRGILASPEFLFRIERQPANVPPNTAYRISDLELASRLSFFLWSSIPDDTLLDLAESGKLKDRVVLQQQVRRMLADRRSEALVNNFGGQWLLIRNVRLAQPDRGEFPDFDGNLRDAFRQETQLFFESMLREDHSILDLLNADYTFLNERLAKHYGIPNIFGSQFRRVTLMDDNRKGLLGKASILTVTSYATRTSPVQRGKWLLENILGTPPPPPPPNVPTLQDRNEEGKILSLRQLMEKHRANPVCASCHARMDPLGFALENFDAIGQWRATSGADNAPVDASGALPDGTKFQGPVELRRMLLGKPDQFVTTVADKLMTYALGRGVEYYDAPAIRNIVREAAASNYRWSAVILGIVNSTPFQMRRSAEAATAVAERR